MNSPDKIVLLNQRIIKYLTAVSLLLYRRDIVN